MCFNEEEHEERSPFVSHLSRKTGQTLFCPFLKIDANAPQKRPVFLVGGFL
jgi:hypothetical protein